MKIMLIIQQIGSVLNFFRFLILKHLFSQSPYCVESFKFKDNLTTPSNNQFVILQKLFAQATSWNSYFIFFFLGRKGRSRRREKFERWIFIGLRSKSSCKKDTTSCWQSWRTSSWSMCISYLQRPSNSIHQKPFQGLNVRLYEKGQLLSDVMLMRPKSQNKELILSTFFHVHFPQW